MNFASTNTANYPTPTKRSHDIQQANTNGEQVKSLTCSVPWQTHDIIAPIRSKSNGLAERFIDIKMKLQDS